MDAQYRMAPLGRLESTLTVSQYSKAAVLCLLYPQASDLHMVFIRRASHHNDKHSAQIAFPGGKVESSDNTIIDTALREANEEIGLDPNQVNIIGEITPLPIPVSRFKVFPVLGYTDQTPIFIPQLSEVDEILEFPIEMLIDPGKVEKHRIKLSSGQWIKNVPVYNINGHIIWGATAMILSEVIEIIRT